MNFRPSWLLALAMFAGSSVAFAESSLESELTGSDGWVAYRVPIVEGAGSPCCYSGKMSGTLSRTHCNLDKRKGTFVSHPDDRDVSSELSVYWHVSSRKADRVRAFAADCAVTSREDVRWIDPVAGADSVRVVADWIGKNNAGDDSADLAALALHADEGATAALVDLASAGRPAELREDALFWLGQARGNPGADFVEQVAKSDPSPDVREHAVFALSESSAKDAYERVHRIAKSDASEEVRGNALFWMAQMDDPRAQSDIVEALARESSEEVREEAVFALSQLDDSIATHALIAVIHGNYPRPIKEKALFWLGQAGTEEAIAFLDDMLTK